MRYPQNADTNLIIRHALYMHAPDVSSFISLSLSHCLIFSIFFFVFLSLFYLFSFFWFLPLFSPLSVISNFFNSLSHSITHSLQKYQCPPNAFVYLSTPRNKPLKNLSSASSSIRSQSLPRNQGKFAKKESRTEASLNLVGQTSALKNDEEFGIVDGYLMDDPEILRMELQDAFNLMSVSRLKLMQYVKTLRKYIPGHQVDELHQTLDGIEELCSLLKPKNQFLLNMAAPVDKAVEATNETSFKTRQPPTTLNIKQKNLPAENPQPYQAVNSLNSRYEVPDNKISKSASRFINNRKEVEMHVFHDFKDFVFNDNNEDGVPRIDPAGDRRNSEWYLPKFQVYYF